MTRTAVAIVRRIAPDREIKKIVTNSDRTVEITLGETPVTLAAATPKPQKKAPKRPGKTVAHAPKAGQKSKKRPAKYYEPPARPSLGIQLRNLYLKRAGLGALVVPQLFTGVWEWFTGYHFSFQDDGSIENAFNSDHARHAFMIVNALRSGVPTDGSWRTVYANNIDIYDIISKTQYEMNIHEEKDTPDLNQASFWLGGVHEFRAKGVYEASLRKQGNIILARFRDIDMVWGWVDEVDAHSAIDYSWLVDDFKQGVAETILGDLVGDKILNGNYWAVVGFTQTGRSGDFKYDLTTKEIRRAR